MGKRSFCCHSSFLSLEQHTGKITCATQPHCKAFVSTAVGHKSQLTQRLGEISIVVTAGDKDLCYRPCSSKKNLFCSRNSGSRSYPDLASLTPV